MRTSMFAAFAVACAAAAFAGQAQTNSGAATAPGASAKPGQTMTLSGCVAAGPTAGDPLRLDNVKAMSPADVASTQPGGATTSGSENAAATGSEKSGMAKPSAYVLSGADMHQYVGQRVQVIGSVDTAAAEANPHASPEAIGTTGVTGGAATLPEFRVQTVKAFGPCPQAH